MENVDPNTAAAAAAAISTTRVQHVAKASSDQLLRKFAEAEADSKPPKKDLRLAKRVKINQESSNNGKTSVSSLAIADGNSLLPPLPPRKKAALMRRLGISRAKIKAREIKNKSIVTLIEKTWRRRVEGASTVLMEKHYNRHRDGNGSNLGRILLGPDPDMEF